jgi:DNA polymerase
MQPGQVVIDFETRSGVDLKKVGAWNYSKHPTTDVLCMAYKVDDEKVRLWKRGDPWPLHLDVAIGNAWPFVAHNAQFEMMIWDNVMRRKYKWPPNYGAWRCTAAKARAHALPGDLERACEVLGLGAQKDKEGSRLMRKMCKPKGGYLK